MKELYDLAAKYMKELEQASLTQAKVIRIYWITNLLCKIVYINNHYQIPKSRKLKYITKIYQTIITAKLVNLENWVANHKQYSVPNATSHSFINSTAFDIITIKTLSKLFNQFQKHCKINLHLLNIPKIQIGQLSTK